MAPKKSTARSKGQRPAKPHPAFPLFAHGSGQWAKKVKGRNYYFGVWADPQAALNRWLDEKDAILAGRERQEQMTDGVTVSDLCNHFLTFKKQQRDTGELADRTFADYKVYCKMVIDFFGGHRAVESLRPHDFSAFKAHLAKPRATKNKRGKVIRKAKPQKKLQSLSTTLNYCRAIFNYGEKNYLFECSVRRLWGTAFNKPKTTAIQKQQNEQDSRFVKAEEIEKLIDAASPTMKAFILLGINAGMGNTDVARIEFKHLDQRLGILELPRSKTGKLRKCFLWPETLSAIKTVLERRAEPKFPELAERVFLTRAGDSWLPTNRDNAVSKEFAKLRKKTKLTRAGLSFYSLRHTFQTVGDETKDFIAVSSIMGHAPKTISDQYREHVSDERLQEVSNHVRTWLYGTST